MAVDARLVTQRMDDSDTQPKLTKHLEDEGRHAWLWTKRIADLGSVPEKLDDGYQRRVGLEVGIPRTLELLLALTIVIEERALARYLSHARVFAELESKERKPFGFSLADAPAS